MSFLIPFARRSVRLVRFGWFCVSACSDYAWRKRTVSPDRLHRLQTEWLSRWAGRLVRIVGADVLVSGRVPEEGLIVCNHLSYLDIAVLGSVAPLCFVSKMEVRRWPVLGVLATCGGTIYIEREKRTDVSRVGGEMTDRIQKGARVVIFPEGTSSGGASVLPFRSSLLAPAIQAQRPITPASIGYSLADGSVADEVCYWRDMTFFPHFLNLLGKRRIVAHVSFGAPVDPGDDRKELALRLHAAVSKMAHPDAAQTQSGRPAAG